MANHNRCRPSIAETFYRLREKQQKKLLVLILHLTGWEGSAVFLQRAISNAFSCREVYLALHMASCWVKHVTSHFVCFIIKFQALRKFSSHKTWSLTLEGATPPVFSTPTEPLLNNSLGRREIWNWKIILFSCCYSSLLERFSFECWKKFNNNVGFVFLHFTFGQNFQAMFSANRKQNQKHELFCAQRMDFPWVLMCLLGEVLCNYVTVLPHSM